MSDQNDTRDRESVPEEEPTHSAGRKLAEPPPATEATALDEQDLSFESDALLDSLLNDPFPRAGTPLGPKLHEPQHRLYSQDEVTVVGQEIDELLAASLAESMRPATYSTTPAPADVTVVGKGLDELLAQAAAESAPPPGPAAAPIKTPALARPAAMPPRPGVPRPAGAPRPAPPRAAPPRREPSIQVPPPTEEGDDEETRVLRLGSELLETQEPTVRLPPNSASPVARSSSSPALEPESFMPPAAFMPESLGPSRGSVLPTPLPVAGTPVVPLDPIQTVRAPYESEAPTGEIAVKLDSLQLRAPAVPRLSRHDPELSSHVAAVPILAQSSVPPGRDPMAREAWLARAALFQSEARAATDPQIKGRLLLAASELWAIVGDLGRARDAAKQASEVSRDTTLAGRQLRQLAGLDRDYATVTVALETEARLAPTTEARAHATYMAAEVQRLVLGDAESARKKLEPTLRAQGADPRGFLLKLAEQLAGTAGAPRLKWPELAEFEPFSRATDELSALRGAPTDAGNSELRTFEQAERALASGNRRLAGEAVAKLRTLPGMDGAARWLAAALLAPESESRPETVELLKPLLNGDSDVSARRALAARALELGDREALREALEGDTRAFDSADKLVLSALSSGDARERSDLLTELAADVTGRPLATAVVLASAPRDDDRVDVGPNEARLEIALGRRLGRLAPGALREAEPLLDALSAASPRHPLPRVLALELALKNGSASQVAETLVEWPHVDHEPRAQRDRELVSALVHELGAQGPAAHAAYERAQTADPTFEGAARALLAATNTMDGAELLEQLAEAEGTGSASALHFLEAALRRGASTPREFHGLLERAAEADPKLVLPARVGEYFARQQGDAERLLSWLRARRPTITDPLELALDLVREALLVAETDMDHAAALLREACEARPVDFAITELYERVAPASVFDRAFLRESAAERANGVARRRLLLEAAAEYARSSDWQGAVRCARAAVEVDGTELARVVLERVALGTPESTRISEELLERAKGTADAAEQREIYEELARIDSEREGGGALLWQSAILERSPRHLPALRRLEHAYIRADRRQDLEPVLATLAETLTGGDAVAAARVGARLRLAAGNWPGVRKLAELAVRADPNSVWALRALSAHARAADDAEAVQGVERRLFDLVGRPRDKATLALRAAEAAARLERWEEAQALLEHALDHTPDHLLALGDLAAVLEARGDFAGAARALEAVAEASRVDSHKAEAWYQAGVLWLDRAENTDQARAALEQAIAIDLGHDDAVIRLQSIYVARGDRQNLAELLQRRLERTTDPEERIAIEVARGRALAELGEPAAAKAALAAALDANPDHYEALQAFAELCLTEGDWLGAEQAFIRLARHAPDAEHQARIYRKLGELYDVALPNAERAELAYLEVLKRVPNDASTVDRLVAVYGRLGAPERAVTVASQLLERAETQDERRERTIRLASVFEQIAGNRKQAEATLERARREWPHDASVLRAIVELHTRGGEHRAAQLLLDRAAMDARRALGTGRFEASLFESLAAVADLRGSPDGAAVAHATLAALAGDEMPVRGGGARACDSTLDDLLAPDLLSPALRKLLTQVGDALDDAYPLDGKSLRTTPLPESAKDFAGQVSHLAEASGLAGLEVQVSPALGSVCLPASSSPPVLVVGQALLDSGDESARNCLVFRALTVLKAHGSALARTAPIDLGPLVAAILSLLVPSFAVQGVDTKKFGDARARLQDKLGTSDDDVANLALEVSGAIGNRASQLATALYQWGNRTALLATGDPLAALRGLALSSGTSGPPAAGTDRVRWIVRNTEARDLMIFSVSEQYSEARRRLGLGGL